MTERTDHIFLCDSGNCLCKTTLSITDEQYSRRFYFSKSLECPVCARRAYEVET
jgi:hypothetical protein